MKFRIEVWTIGKLLDLVDSNNINLNPPYQRNAIWTLKTQKLLIQSIKDGSPIPNIFLNELTPGNFEMVDGQQRTRALLIYRNTNEIQLTENDDEFKKDEFANYQIPITIITDVKQGEYIEEFYYMVNSSGMKLNRPEIHKAQYFDTNFLKLVEKLNISQQFQELNIIPATSQKRMMDRELVEELCALVLFGITDKKNQVDKIYESDITTLEADNCEVKFLEIISHLQRFNHIKLLKLTRYRQRNDFYTLFGFIKDNLNLSDNTFDYFYQILLILEIGIRPTKDACIPLAEYAFNCVSQSNSSKARQSRLEILNSIFLNEGNEPNTIQNEILVFYNEKPSSMIKEGKYLVFDKDILSVTISEFHSLD